MADISERVRLVEQPVTNAIRKSALEEAASLIESFSAGQIRLAAGEMSAQEMRAAKAVQRWWVAAIRHKAAG